MTVRRVTNVVLCSLMLLACSKHSKQASNAGEFTPASSPSSAAEAIAQARCARERRCENVGTDRKYASNDECLTHIRNDWKSDLESRECKGGVKQTELDECLAKIRNEDCGSPFDTLSRIAECTAARYCMD